MVETVAEGWPPKGFSGDLDQLRILLSLAAWKNHPTIGRVPFISQADWKHFREVADLAVRSRNPKEIAWVPPRLGGIFLFSFEDDSLVVRNSKFEDYAKIALGSMKGVRIADADFSGAHLMGLDLQGADLAGANLSHSVIADVKLGKAEEKSIWVGSRTDFSGATLGDSDLSNGSLRSAIFDKVNVVTRCDLTCCDFTGASLKQANLSLAILRGACFKGADLTGAILRGACLANANFESANLTDADLEGANLDGAVLTRSNLSGANLRNTAKDRFLGWPYIKPKYWLDDTNVHLTIFSPKPGDPYSILRRSYTGARFALILALTLLSFLPFLLKAGKWTLVGALQDALRQQEEALVKFYDSQLDILKVTAAQKALAVDQYRAALKAMYSPSWPEFVVGELVLGFEQGFFVAILSTVLLVYAGIRAKVTIDASAMRESEERSSVVPPKREYETLFLLHRILWALLFISLTIAVVNFSGWIFSTVRVPADQPSLYQHVIFVYDWILRLLWS